jgi:hypothetical protein
MKALGLPRSESVRVCKTLKKKAKQNVEETRRASLSLPHVEIPDLSDTGSPRAEGTGRKAGGWREQREVIIVCYDTQSTVKTFGHPAVCCCFP